VLDSGLDVSGPNGAPDGKIDELDETIIAPGVEVMQVAYHFTFHADPQPVPPAALPVAGATPGTVLTVQQGAPNDAVKTERGVAISLVSGNVPTAFGTAAHTITRPDFTSAVLQDAKFYTQASLFDYAFGPPIAPERKTNYLANVRAVQVMLVTRSSTPAPDGASSPVPGPSAPVLNMNATPAWLTGASTTTAGSDRFARIRLDTTVTASNMVSRRLLYE
jgi:type IV pilus assembly protein PilW